MFRKLREKLKTLIQKKGDLQVGGHHDKYMKECEQLSENCDAHKPIEFYGAVATEAMQLVN